ncbi:unnamed protein product [Cuscuta epithymum]|uniref:Uncharacterized protein n=2 Tax=Cuscuta epithymum TaxID=186058 RepID=A0AAV0D7R6_9ASTE|nr:unnamed protein product [Cuscuta epithymum]
MDSPFFEDILDPSKCSKLRMEEKRELVYKLSNMPTFSPEMLQSWSRQDILEILCAEMGKERKYTGLTKLKIIESLIKIVVEKKRKNSPLENGISSSSKSEKNQGSFKRQRKPDHFHDATSNVFSDLGDNGVIHCKNLACRARLKSEVSFCKRCSCCVCREYDDNKDPSLWLFCNSDPPFEHWGESCGMSCHLECAIRHERSGIVFNDSQDRGGGINGSFNCVSCGKTNDLLGSLRKQLVTARDTRRVDILCYRISLSQKILGEAKKCNDLCTVMDEAVKRLEEEVGPLSGSPVKTARGIVNRLSSGPEVQRLCGLAVEYLDSVLSKRVLKVAAGPTMEDSNRTASKLIRLEDVSTTFVTVILTCEESRLGNTVGYTMWHRKADDSDYPVDPTCTLLGPTTRFVMSGLIPNTEYLLKLVFPADSKRELGICELQFRTREEAAASVNDVPHPNTQNSEEAHVRSSDLQRNNPPQGDNTSVSCYTDDSNNDGNITCMDVLLCCNDEEKSVEETAATTQIEEDDVDDDDDDDDDNEEEATSTDNGGSNTPPSGLPITPPYKRESRSQPGESSRKEEGNAQVGTSSKKKKERGGEREEEWEDDVLGEGDKGFEYYVKVIRWLECNGRIGTGFREKFLTWYSLRATPQEVRVVKTFVDTLIEDPESLAAQLLHSFSDLISKRSSISNSSLVPSGFCLRLWH